jgi:aspartate racemase
VKRLGLLGGMAWPSTMAAYRLLNEGVQARLGGFHSAPLILWSVDFAEVERLQAAGDWAGAGHILAAAAVALQTAGAEGLLLCTNTMHRVADAIEEATDIPLLHIADATATRIQRDGMDRVGLLGTRFTMEQDFYRGRLERRGLEVLVPTPPQRGEVHRIIYDELVHGQVRDDSRDVYLEVIAALVSLGADAIIAGCTEIELLITAEDLEVPYYPTTTIHTEAAVDWILGE